MKILKLKDGETYKITEKEFAKIIQAVNSQSSVYIERVELLVNPFHIAKVSTPQILVGKEILMDSSGNMKVFGNEFVRDVNFENGEYLWGNCNNLWSDFLVNEGIPWGRKLEKKEDQELRQKYVGRIKSMFIPADQYLENMSSKTKQLESSKYLDEDGTVG